MASFKIETIAGLPSKYFRVVVVIIHLFQTPKLPQKSFWPTIHYPAGVAGQGLVSYSFLLLLLLLLLSSSGNTSFSHTSLHPILTKLGQSDQYLDHYSGTNDDGVRGHDGVTGVKKVISPKRHQVLQIT